MAQQSLQQKSKELRKIQADHQDATTHVQQLQAELASTQQYVAAVKSKTEQLENQVVPRVFCFRKNGVREI